ncbi:low molecular weight protein-tyrosine-phosphatase [Neomicrococcus lactis]|uniref:protein-tyrosine-phosphatase n=1 Tax=Neomicrococcus lactis TaxID=732241 RepID=A0A7W9DCV0_9MICC|nr:low molecular weight protein-tyrosine-phosphatase [Neomicrococcus lactis]MBB5599272.1 protein-tyrosine phosphatase [Neomicrococcus lactis]
MTLIAVICTGNICRSPMAEHMIRAAAEEAGLFEVFVTSAATTGWEVGNPIDPRALAILRELGLDAEDHVARQFEVVEFNNVDLVLALDTEHYMTLRHMAPTAHDRAKVRMIRAFDPKVAHHGVEAQGIYDPWYGEMSDFETVRDLISAAIPGIIDYVREIHENPRRHQSPPGEDNDQD